MINHVLKLHTFIRWKRFIIVFLLAGVTIYAFEPMYIEENTASLSIMDWLLEVSGSLLVIYFFATLAVITLTFDTTHWLWTSFGTSSVARIAKRSTLFWAYIILITFIVTYVLIVILFWAFIIGYVRYGGYSVANMHPLFQFTDSPIFFNIIRWIIDWWALFFIATIGVLSAFVTKNVLFSFLVSFGWSFGLIAAFKSGVFLRGLLPGEGMLLAVHDHGISPFWLSVVNEVAVLFSLGILYLVIIRVNLVIPRANR